jgi:hypothetical protein
MSKSIPPTWWEKTVEYNFVIRVQNEEVANFLAPLDGNVEQIGDAVIGKDSKFFIVEFKKTLSIEDSEYKKYNNGKDGYNRAKVACMKINKGLHHLIIGGKLSNLKKTLELEIRHYFDEKEIPSNSIKKSLTHGVGQDILDQYILALINERSKEEHRLGDDEDEGGGDGGGGVTLASIIGLSANGCVSTIDLEYYRLKRKLKPEPKPNNTYNPKI